MCVCGVLIEMGHSASWSIHDKEGALINLNDLQHSTMYVAFLLCAVLDILSENSSKLEGLDGLFYGLAFFAEGFMFFFHLHGRPMVDVQIHTLLVTACFFNAITAVIARWKGASPVPSIAFALSGMVQGGWFIHAGFLLYPPGLEEDQTYLDLMDMEAMMYVTVLFIWHILMGLAMVLVLYFILRLVTPVVHRQKTAVKHRLEKDPSLYKTVPTTNSSYSQFYVDSD